jgi:hypothetical protein
MCSHVRIKFDQHLAAANPKSEKLSDGLKKVYAVLQTHLDAHVIEQKTKRTSPRLPNPFIHIAAQTEESDVDDGEEEELTIVATYFDSANLQCKRIMSNGPL